MEWISELLPEEDVQKLKSVPKRLPLYEGEIVWELKEFGVDAYGYDPLLSDEMIEGVGVKVSDDQDARVDCVIVTVAHDEFREMELLDMGRFMATGETPCWWMCGECLNGSLRKMVKGTGMGFGTFIARFLGAGGENERRR